MIEQKPHGPSPIPEPQHAPHEGGNGSLGLPPSLNERATPPPESPLKLMVEEMRAVYEKDPNLFATRAMEALDSLLKESMPHAEQWDEGVGQEIGAAYGEIRAQGEYPDMFQAMGMAERRGESRGYVDGLKDAFLDLYERITHKPAHSSSSRKRPAYLKGGNGDLME